MALVYVGLGSNLAQPEQQLLTALDELAVLPGTRVLHVSSLYRSAPMGPSDQPDYINAVAALETGFAPEALLQALQTLENRHQRVRLQRWGSRTLDLDILLYGDQVIDTATLSVPHPGLTERNFVLIPLLEVAPELCLPDGRSLVELAGQCSRDGLVRLSGDK